jgi:16S rRNA (guanine966-N2)-methyltransferase
MRIVGGRLGGRRIAPPPGNVTRPTSERVREAVASALAARGAIEGARVLDLYAGTGALGFEMLSRGAARTVFVERDPKVAEHIRKAARELAVEAAAHVIKEDIAKPRAHAAILAQGPYDLVLADPPYRDVPHAVASILLLCQSGLLAEGAVLLLEHAAKTPVSLPPEFVVRSSYRYGDTAVVLFEYTTSKGELR